MTPKSSVLFSLVLLSASSCGGGADAIRPVCAAKSLFTAGEKAQIAGSRMRLDYVSDDPAGPLATLGGLWPTVTYGKLGVNRVFKSGDGSANSTYATMFLRAEAAGSAAEIVPLIPVALVTHDGGHAFGLNTIVATPPLVRNVKLVGYELDWQPGKGTTIDSSSAGMYMNFFNAQAPVALQLDGIGGGTVVNGIKFNVGVRDAALSGGVGTTIGTLVDSGGSHYGQDAPIKLSHGHRLAFRTSTGSLAAIYVDDNDMLRVTMPNRGGLALRDANDSVTLLGVDASGNLSILGSLKISGTAGFNGVAPAAKSVLPGALATNGTASSRDLALAYNAMRQALVSYGLTQ